MPNNDYISREAASKAITELMSSPWATEGTHSIGIKEALSLVRDMIRGNVPKGMQIPVADVRPVVRGEWEKEDEFSLWRRCSHCGEPAILTMCRVFKFCPNCGADMRQSADMNKAAIETSI